MLKILNHVGIEFLIQNLNTMDTIELKMLKC